MNLSSSALTFSFAWSFVRAKFLQLILDSRKVKFPLAVAYGVPHTIQSPKIFPDAFQHSPCWYLFLLTDMFYVLRHKATRSRFYSVNHFQFQESQKRKHAINLQVQVAVRKLILIAVKPFLNLYRISGTNYVLLHIRIR